MRHEKDESEKLWRAETVRDETIQKNEVRADDPR